MLGTELPAPVALAPIGTQKIVHPEGELAVARAAAAVGLPMALSTVSASTLEEMVVSSHGGRQVDGAIASLDALPPRAGSPRLPKLATMLILPPGHAEALRKPQTVRPREKVMIGGVIGVIAVLAVALVISFATAGHKSGHGCISVGLAYSTGGAQIYRCGGSARALCATVNQPGGSTGATARALTTECRKAGLPVG